MDIRTVSATVHRWCRRLAAIATAAALGLGAVPAVAQTASQSLATRAEEQAQIVYSPWTKFCGKDQKTPANEVCLTVKEGRTANGRLVAGATLIEQEGGPRKILRITLPSGMRNDARVIVDDDQPILGRHVGCFSDGCLTDFAVNADFVVKLKRGETITLQGDNSFGQSMRYPMSLDGFARANEGIPTRPVFEEQQKKRGTLLGGQRIRCAGAYDLCAWKRIPDGRR